MSYYYRHRSVPERIAEGLIDLMPYILTFLVLFFVMLAIFVPSSDRPLGERVVVVDDSQCSEVTHTEGDINYVDCVLKLRVVDPDQVSEISSGDFRHVKLLVEGEQYAPAPEQTEEDES